MIIILLESSNGIVSAAARLLWMSISSQLVLGSLRLLRSFSSVCCAVVVTCLRLRRSSWLMPWRTWQLHLANLSAPRRTPRGNRQTTRRCQRWRIQRRLVPSTSGHSPIPCRPTMSFPPSVSTVTVAHRRISACSFSDKLIQGVVEKITKTFARRKSPWKSLGSFNCILVHGVLFGFV